MHNPDVVAFTIVRPWPQRSTLPAPRNGKRWAIRLHHDHLPSCLGEGCTGQPFPWWRPRSYSRFWRIAGHGLYWPALITIWHREPGGANGLDVCQHRYQDKHGRWRFSRGWHWHVHHWHFQVHPLQHLRRWLLTRCAACGGRDRKANRVNFSLGWDNPRGPWWRGEHGLYHEDCIESRRHAGQRAA